MAKSSSKTKGAKPEAEARFRQLVDELKLLTVAFPHLRESFDEDELPVSFILKRQHDRVVAARRPKRASKRPR
jgi:hypothetical protein